MHRKLVYKTIVKLFPKNESQTIIEKKIKKYYLIFSAHFLALKTNFQISSVTRSLYSLEIRLKVKRFKPIFLDFGTGFRKFFNLV